MAPSLARWARRAPTMRCRAAVLAAMAALLPLAAHAQSWPAYLSYLTGSSVTGTTSGWSYTVAPSVSVNQWDAGASRFIFLGSFSKWVMIGPSRCPTGYELAGQLFTGGASDGSACPPRETMVTFACSTDGSTQIDSQVFSESPTCRYQLRMLVNCGGSDVPGLVCAPSPLPAPTPTPCPWAVAGDATLLGSDPTSGCFPVQLTPSGASKVGAAWQRTRMRVDDTVRMQFTLSVTDASGGYADGMAFVLHRDFRGFTALGGAGGAVGLASGGSNIRAVAPSFGLLFDTYNSGSSSSFDFVSNGSVPTAGSVVLTPTFDWWYSGGVAVDVTYNINTRMLSACYGAASGPSTYSACQTRAIDLPAALGCASDEACYAYYGA